MQESNLPLESSSNSHTISLFFLFFLVFLFAGKVGEGERVLKSVLFEQLLVRLRKRAFYRVKDDDSFGEFIKIKTVKDKNKGF